MRRATLSTLPVRTSPYWRPRSGFANERVEALPRRAAAHRHLSFIHHDHMKKQLTHASVVELLHVGDAMGAVLRIGDA